MYFNQSTMKVGGKVRIPDSANPKTYGDIIQVSSVGINVVYYPNTKDQQVCFYSFAWLEHTYAPKQKNREELSDDISDVS